MKQIIASIVVQAYALDFGLCQKLVSCDNAKVLGFEWFTPIVNDGLLSGYRNVVLNEKPTPDSIKTIKVQVDGRMMNIAVADNAPITDFSDACNACCDNGTVTLAAPVVPQIRYEEQICIGIDNLYRISAFIPFTYAGQRLQLGMLTCNGDIKNNPAFPVNGFADKTAMLTFLTTNYAALGTFALQLSNGGVGPNAGDFLTLASLICASASLSVELLKQNFCATVTFPLIYKGYKTNAKANVVFAETKTATNMQELIGQLGSYFPDGLLTSPVAGKLNYYGIGVPEKILAANGTSTAATFTAGACV